MTEFVLEELSIEVTNLCPMSCLHCSSGSKMEKLPNELSYTEHSMLIGEAVKLGATVLSISGGEPLMYCPIEFSWDKDVPIAYLLKLADGYEFERILLYTTGHHAFGDRIWEFPEINTLLDIESLTWIFSLHSHHHPINDYIMNVPDATQHIKESIEWLIARNQDVELHMVPMAPNYKHIPDMRLLAERMGVSKLSLLRFVPQTRGKANVGELGMTKSQFAEMQFIMHQEVEKNGDHFTEVRLGCPIDFRHAVGLIDEKAKPCHAGDDLILVRPDGDVHPCAAWKSLPDCDNVYRVWDEHQNALDWIWNNSDTYRLLREFKYGYGMFSPGWTEIEYGPCVSCRHNDNCMTGCLAQRLHAYGGLLRPKGEEPGQTSIGDLMVPCSDPLCPKGGCSDSLRDMWGI